MAKVSQSWQRMHRVGAVFSLLSTGSISMPLQIFRFPQN
jgi:hypothetical protein